MDTPDFLGNKVRDEIPHQQFVVHLDIEWRMGLHEPTGWCAGESTPIILVDTTEAETLANFFFHRLDFDFHASTIGQETRKSTTCGRWIVRPDW